MNPTAACEKTVGIVVLVARIISWSAATCRRLQTSNDAATSRRLSNRSAYKYKSGDKSPHSKLTLPTAPLTDTKAATSRRTPNCCRTPNLTLPKRSCIFPKSKPMKHIIVGTAGHIDHGKTALVKALTGIDADRLKEEK